MEVKWDGPPVVKADPNQGQQAQNSGQGGIVPPPPPPPPPPACAPGAVCLDPNKVYGSIVQMVRENGGVTLYLDKGSSDKLHAGMSGTILDGPDGDKPFEGGSFAITQVVDSGKSIARSTTLQKSLGKNRRISVNLK